MKYTFTFKPNKKGLRKILGDLEVEIMELAWRRKEITVRQIYDILREDRVIAYTTVMTVASRLSDKGLLKKIRAGNAFLYRPVVSKQEFTQSTLKKIINELLQDFATPVIKQFVDSIGENDPEKIEELSRLIKEKRKQRDV